MKKQAQARVKEELTSFYKNCPDYFNILQEDGTKNKLQESRLEETVALLEEGDTYLDVASGAGVLVNYAVSKKRVYALGVELSYFGCQLAREEKKKTKGKAVFIVSDVENLGLKNDSIDKVSSFETLEHLVDPRRALDEMVRCLKKGGLLILSIPHWFIGIHKRPDWVLNLLKLPFLLVGMFLTYRLRHRFLVRPTPFFLEKERWVGASASDIADLDAVSWIWSESLYDYLKEKGLTIVEYDTYRYLKDTLVSRKDSFLGPLKMKIFSLFSKTPFLRHLGSCIFIIARKEQ
jgi:ubiquinone/menaquinone biosynthesis C-methylase UbiE